MCQKESWGAINQSINQSMSKIPSTRLSFAQNQKLTSSALPMDGDCPTSICTSELFKEGIASNNLNCSCIIVLVSVLYVYVGMYVFKCVIYLYLYMYEDMSR